MIRIPVTSHMFSAIAHDPETDTLEVTYRSTGRTYRLADVSAQEFDDLRHAESVGRHFLRALRTTKGDLTPVVDGPAEEREEAS